MLNDLWAEVLFRTCHAHGMRHVVLCPGARSTPLAVALYLLSEARLLSVITHYDERGAAFYALGLAKATGVPVGIVTTSGTAVANLLPAVVEAQKSNTPLFVITADRPPELTFSGANQTLDQGQLLSAVVAYAHTLPVPTADVAVTSIAYTVAYAMSQSLSKRQPVVLNCPFREPLSAHPTTCAFTGCLPLVQAGDALTALPETLLLQIGCARSGVIVAGIGADPEAVLDLAVAYAWPVLPDVGHPLRYVAHPLVVTYADLLASEDMLDVSDLVLHLGDSMTGQALPGWIKKQETVVRMHHRDDFGDPLFMAAYIGIGAIPFAQLAAQTVHPSAFEIPANPPKLAALVSDASEYALFHTWDQWLPTGWGLFLGNSQPIRQMAAVGMASSRPLMKVGTNRGASGIDGLIATAGGFMAGHGCPGVLILGDLSFLHDLSSLAMVAEQPLLILVIQNHGGAIFSRFGVKNHPSFDAFFRLEHSHSCRDAAQWALDDVRSVDILGARVAIDEAIARITDSGRAACIEIHVRERTSDVVATL